MTAVRAPRSRHYDGAWYARLMDPFLSNLHGFVADQVEQGLRVLDVGCGTGVLALRLAPKAAEVVGVELSPAMVEYARARLGEAALTNVSFVLGDAAHALASRPNDCFDVATMVLALHEMPAEARAPVLREAARVARRVLCVDFRAPMSLSLAGLRNRFFEMVAGLEHFRAFRDFQRRGGTPGVAGSAGLGCTHLRFVDSATLDVCELRR